MMEILYDVSDLSNGYFHPRLRTGIFRVAENFIHQAIQQPDLRIQLTSCTNARDAILTRFWMQTAAPELRLHFLDSWQSDPIAHHWYRQILTNIYDNTSRSFLNRLRRKSQTLLLDLLAQPMTPVHYPTKTVDIYHSLYSALPGRDRIPTKTRIITVHDLIPVLYPHFFLKSTVAQFNKILNSIEVDRDWVICVSESTQRDFCALTSMPEDRVFVTPLAADQQFYRQQDPQQIAAVMKKYGIPAENYVLSLSTLEPRKNIAHLIKCFFNVIKTHHLTDCFLVLVGSKGWLFNEIFQTLDLNADLRERVICTSYVPDEDLGTLYSGARLFVYPSLYEGFGLPPLEAMQCGVPVITSNTSSLPEVVGTGGIMVDPTSEEALCNAMLRVLKDDDLWQDLSQKSLQQAAKFSWSACANKTVKIYEQVLARI